MRRKLEGEFGMAQSGWVHVCRYMAREFQVDGREWDGEGGRGGERGGEGWGASSRYGKSLELG